MLRNIYGKLVSFALLISIAGAAVIATSATSYETRGDVTPFFAWDDGGDDEDQ